MQRPQPESVTLNDVLITEELSGRSPRDPNWHSEAQAMQTLARQMANDSETMFQSLANIAVELCQAGTAGVSLLETTPNGAEVFRWTVLAGTLAQDSGGTTPRHFSPCGVCLDRGTPVLFSHPERYFTYFREANTPIVESLVLPLIAAHHAFGTIWILSHDEQRHFDAEDVRLMTSLADFAATALLIDRRQTRELLAANAALEAEIAEREQTEEKLREAQRRLELSLTGAKFGVWSYNVGTGEFWADERAKRMHGHEPHEVHTFAEAGANIHPEDCERAQAAIAQAIQDRSKLQLEYRAIWNGSVHWIASYAEFMPTGDLDEGIFYGVAQDISDRKQVEMALRESEERSLALIENLPGGAVFVVDREFRYLLAEGEALSTAGFKPEDLIGQTIFEVLPPELAKNYETLYRKALEGKSFEHEHDAHDRSYISRGTPLRSPNGEVYAVLAISYDITERKRAEQALGESEAKYRTLFTSIEDGFCIIEVLYDEDNTPFDFRFLEVSPSFEAQTGISQAQGKTAREVEPNDDAGLLEHYNRVAITGEPSHFEIWYNFSQWYDVYAFPYGKLEDRQVAIIFTNISDRKSAEAARIQLIQEQAARLEAERASQMKDEFLAMISHELQSPLVAILGWTRLLRANPPTPAMLTKSLETIERNATLQAKLIQDLLDISCISAGKVRLNLQPIELASVIETAIATVSKTAEARRIDLRFTILDLDLRLLQQTKQQPIPQNLKFQVLGDDIRLQQVICNLLSNAIKFTPLGRVTVELSTSEGEPPQLASYAEIRVIDTGIGMSAEFLPHVFDRFSQAEKSGSAGGLGLGLAIAHHLVELHNGLIRAHSAGEGQGATFIVKLPLL